MFVLLVDVVLDWQQVVAHSLEGKLMQDRRHGVECPVQDDQLWTSFVWTLGRGEMDRSENQHMGHCCYAKCRVWLWPSQKRKQITASDLSHGGIISLVSVQFVLNQLSQGGIIFVLTVWLTENKGMWGKVRRRREMVESRSVKDLNTLSNKRNFICHLMLKTYPLRPLLLTLGIGLQGTPLGWHRVWQSAPPASPSQGSSAGSCGDCRNCGRHQDCPESTPAHTKVDSTITHLLFIFCPLQTGWTGYTLPGTHINM